MEKYMNFGGNSNVVAYEIGIGEISVMFNGGKTYLYTNASAGFSNITQMQRLAKQGHGLNSFIKKYVNKGYARILN